jgi:hypothetical protein
MKISEDDTYQGNFVFFTEELIRVPLHISDTIDRIKKTRKWGRSIYVDGIKIRLLIDVRKNRDDYSYSPTGRISQFGKDMSFLKKRSDPRALFHLGSMIQDVCLHTDTHDGAVYFPHHIIGEGKPPLFDNPRNVLRFWLRQNNGAHMASLLRIAVESLFYRTDRGLGSVRSDLLLNASVGMRHSKNEAWRVTFKPIDDESFKIHQLPSVPRYEKFTAPILSRLSEFIISEREIVGAQAKSEFITSLLEERDVPIRPFRLIDIEPGEIPATTEEIKEFFKVWLNDPNSFRAIKLERYYDREAVEDLLGERYPLSVPLKLEPSFTILRERPRKDKLEDHEAVALYEWLKKAYSDPENVVDIPRENLSDDEFILDDLYLNRPIIFLVSDDIKLARALSRMRALHDHTYRTYRLDCHLWSKGGWTHKNFNCEFMTDLNVEVDMGSVTSYFQNLTIDEDTAAKAYAAIGAGSSILLKRGTDIRTLRIPDIKPGQKYERPSLKPVVETEGEDITFPPFGFPERYRVVPEYDPSTL